MQQQQQQQEGEPWLSTLRSFKRLVTSGEQEEQDLESPPFTLLPASAAEAADNGSRREEPQWASWARAAAWRMREQTTQAAEQAHAGLQTGLERAQSLDWQEKAGGMKGQLSNGLESVSKVTSTASSSLGGRLSQGLESARSVEWSEKAKNMKQGFDTVATNAQTASATVREGAQSAAGASRRVLSTAGEQVSGAAQLAMDPARLLKFMGVLFLGIVLIVISFNFLPFLLLKPGNFAVFFTAGSMTIMSSFVVLSGSKGFLEGLMQRKRLPFSAAYGVGLVGTLWATIIQRSFIFTAVFAIVQAGALLYLVFSYLPGGTSFLNLLGRTMGRAVR